MAKPNRAEELRDLIVSLEQKAVIGLAIGSDELKRPLEELKAEREELKAKTAKEDHARAEAEAASHRQAKRDACRDAARKLMAQHTPDEIRELRAAARGRMLAAKREYEHLSAAVQVLESNERLQAVLAQVTPEEREAFLETLK